MPTAPVQSNYVTNIAKSMTIDEMRELHQRALDEAEAKETELRLVLASRYRELVGSSDEVLDMQCRAKELDKVVKSLPGIVEALALCVESKVDDFKNQEEGKGKGGELQLQLDKEMGDGRTVLEARRVLSNAPRLIHACLDQSDVHGAATALIQIFTLISSYTNEYLLANVLSDKQTQTTTNEQTNSTVHNDPHLHAQIKMIFLHVQTLPARTIKLSRRQLLLQSSSTSKTGCQIVASALSALNLLDVKKATGPESLKAAKLMDLYFDSKAKLIHGLLGQMSVPTNSKEGSANIPNGLSSYYTPEATDQAEQIISKIVRILQYDVILHPYQIFILRRFAANPNDEETNILSTLPKFDQELLKNKASNFLAAHLPLIRTKVKSVLVAIAGTTASRLGHIRQSLYDKTDGVDCRKELDGNSVSTWDEAVASIVDVKIVTHGLDGMTSSAIITTSTASSGSAHTTLAAGSTGNRKFSLWGTLFSNTFSSLVNSLLSASFHSVHARVVATLRASLANAPALRSILPHEAYRNSLRIATDLDASLKKVSDDAHELLVHAEERDESERRLRQSLYVQTCEIMGRLINELRRMLMGKKNSIHAVESEDEEEAARDLIVGRLCHLLKFRLTTLPTLLDPNSSPAVLAARAGGKVGMISVAELQSAFEITDDTDTGLITFNEAMDAMEGAFSGTHFHGAEMVRETMLLSAGSDGTSTEVISSSKVGVTPRNLTLLELVLLSARGLRHELGGPESALGTIQRSLDDIVQTCFTKWAHVALSLPMKSFRSSLEQFMDTALTVPDLEWNRLHNLGEEDPDELLRREIGDALLEDTVNGDSPPTPEALQVGSVSTHVMSYLLSVTSILNQSVCPTDSLQPYPSCEYASAMGIELGSADSPDYDLTMIHTLRSCLLQESLVSMVQTLNKVTMAPIHDSHSSDEVELEVVKCSAMSLVQMYLDLNFVSHCFFKRNIYGFTSDTTSYKVDGEEDSEYSASHSKKLLEKMSENISSSLLKAEPDISIEESLSPIVLERNRAAFDSCDLFFSSIFGKDYSVMTSDPSTYEGGITSYAFASMTSESPPLMLVPLSSSRRFTLLPIQAERSVTELQLLGNIGKDKIDKAATERVNSTSAASYAVSSGLGFLSSMLKKK